MKHLFIALVRFYQIVLSPIKGGSSCRFYPSCSRYSIESFQKHGAIKGMILTGWRILRCNPWNLGGLDDVPDKFLLVPFGARYRKNDNLPQGYEIRK